MPPTLAACFSSRPGPKLPDSGLGTTRAWRDGLRVAQLHLCQALASRAIRMLDLGGGGLLALATFLLLFLRAPHSGFSWPLAGTPMNRTPSRQIGADEGNELKPDLSGGHGARR